ncbi:MAG: M28 family peptidase [Gemmatimonadetes bacterium]|nr:M28 family peptidase [Gemmatimonadota bacterium]
MRSPFIPTRAILLGLAVAPALLGAQSAGKLNRFGNPSTMKPTPTSAAITPKDLQIRLYQFADDSMLGRQVGRIGNMKGTTYIAAEVKRLGLIPAGDNGTYFQVLPFHTKQYTNHSRLTANGNPLAWNKDWVAVPGSAAPKSISNVEVIFGGTQGDTTKQISAALANGKFVVVLPAAPVAAAAGGRGGPGGPGGGGGRGGFAAPSPSRFAGAVAVATVDLDGLTDAQRVAINVPTVAAQGGAGGRGGRGGRAGGAGAPIDSLAILRGQIDQLTPQAQLRVTKAAAAELFGGRGIDGMTAGTRGGTVSASLDFVELPTEWARNVVAILPGSDPVLKNQYVAIGAHNDHVGFTGVPVDKDSLKVFNDIRNKMLLENKMIALTQAQLAAIRVNMDSIRKVVPKARLDSINNGADDDGSGSMGVLEIAEYMASMKVKPKRSTLFVWHTGEEGGLIGSAFFTANPTVPIDSVVAQLNIDMIGRGRAEDLPGGSPDYLGVVGSYFDSKDLGEVVKSVNVKQANPLQLDYKFDDSLSWSGYNNIYGRSDHYNYAKVGVPIAFFFTGLHGDYHQKTDEPEFIDYPHYAKITNYIEKLVEEVGNGPRPRMNGSKPAKPPKPTVP